MSSSVKHPEGSGEERGLQTANGNGMSSASESGTVGNEKLMVSWMTWNCKKVLRTLYTI